MSHFLDTGQDDNGADEAVFESAEDIRPGGYASWDIRVKNVGAVAWQIVDDRPHVTEVSDPGNDCPDGHFGPVATRRLGKAGDETSDDPVGDRVPPESAFTELQPNNGQMRSIRVKPGDYEDLRLRVTTANVAGCDGNEWNVPRNFEATTTGVVRTRKSDKMLR